MRNSVVEPVQTVEFDGSVVITGICAIAVNEKKLQQRTSRLDK
jgi:hypothetical protein